MWPPPAATLVAMSGPRQTWTHVALWLGLLAAVVGTVVAVTHRRIPTGWFAYAPLSDYAFVAGTTNWPVVIGAAVAVSGAVVAAFAAGRLSVRRRR